jgi:hypothetical protein
VGWQVGTTRLLGYVGAENVRVTDEATQAAIYAELDRRAACDPDIASVSLFGFRDDGLRTGFQAGLQRVDGTSRPSAEAVRRAIAETAGGCTGRLVSWRPWSEVLGARMAVAPATTTVTARIGAGEDARGAVCVRSLARRSAGSPACRRFAVQGLRPLTLALSAPAPRVEIAVRLTALANAKRKSLVVARTALRR